jgi:ABC-2 type transport system permease protein
MASYRLNSRLAVALIALNLIVFNVLASDVSAARLDLTADGLYTLSDVTRDTLQDLQEPLLIRGYFSEENHPLLEPLIPVIRDTLEEYRIASNGNLDVEFIDPIDDPELEAEANQTYGIRPTPLQVVDRAGSSLLNIYFDILIRYGDQTEVITFGELIEVDQFGDEIEVRLRNLEYDLTSRIRRVVSGFQSIDAVLAALEEPARLTFYVTPGTLPEDLAEVPATIDSVANEIASISGGNFVFETVDPSDPASGVSPESLFNTYEIRPISAGFFSPDSYYLHMVLQAGGQSQVIYPTGAFSEAEVRTSIESALKRVSTGFLQVVGVWLPPQQPTVDQFGQQIPSLAQYTIIATALNENYEVRPVDLSTGQVPADIDVLFLIAPQNFGVREVFAVDQFVMRGGSLLVAAARYRLTLNSDGSIAVAANEGTLADLLASYGINVEPTLVLDTQNEPFPLPTQRNVGGVTVTEMRALDFPHFVDVRPDGMDRDTPIFSNLPAITMSFVSPVTADPALTDGMDVITLLQSTGDSWTSNSTSIIPNPDIYPETGFQVTTERGPRSLAVAVTGSFTSAFAGQPSPFAPEPTLEPPPPTETPEPDPEATAEATSEATPEVTAEPAPVDPLALVGAIEQSPPNTRIMVIGSVEFLNDNLLQLSTQISGDRYLNNLAFVENAVDWFTEDTALSSIRASGASTRLLDELDESEETQWEVINYALALASVVVLGVIWRVRKGAEQPMELVPRDGAPVVAAAPVVEPEDGPEPDEPDEIEPDDGDAGGADTEADDDDRTGGDA